MATKAATSTKKSSGTRSRARKNGKTASSAPATASRSSFVGTVQQSVRSTAVWRALGAELVGTFLLASVIFAVQGQGQPIFVLFVLVGIVLLIGGISGAHINPAITIGAWVTRRIGWFKAITYIVAQVLGAALAYWVFSMFIAGASPVTAEAAAYGQTAPALFKVADVTQLVGKEWYVFFAELLGTAVLGLAVANALRAAKDRVASALTVGVGIFIALMITVTVAGYVGANAIINPAVAVALQGYSWSSLWPFAIYAIAPVVGAIVGFVVHDILSGRNAK